MLEEGTTFRIKNGYGWIVKMAQNTEKGVREHFIMKLYAEKRDKKERV